MLNILQAIGSIGTFIMAILYFVSVMIQIRQIKISFIPFLAFDQIIIEQTQRLKLKNLTESDTDYVNTAFKLQNLGGGTAKNIDIKVYLDEEGNADIEEVWNVKGSDGTEWYKVLNNMGNMELSNYKVYMDNKLLNYKEWDVDESLSEKRGYYGINKTNNGLELCFGKYDYNTHTFTLEYDLKHKL